MASGTIRPNCGNAPQIPAAPETPASPYLIAGAEVEAGEFFGPYQVYTRMIRVTKLPTSNLDLGGNIRIIRWCGLLWRPGSSVPYPIHDNSADPSDIYGQASLDFRSTAARGFRIDLPEGSNLTDGTGIVQIWYVNTSDVY